MKLTFPIFFEWYGLMPHMKYVNMFVIRVFSHTFPLLWKLTYPMGFRFTRNPYKSLTFGIFLFSHNFPVLSEFTFPMFGKLYEFLLHVQYSRNTEFCNACVFPYFCRTKGIHFSHVFGNCMYFCLLRNM